VNLVSKDRREENNSSRLSFWAGLAMVSFVFIAGAIFSWRRWPDLVGDFGMQLYIPWQLSGSAVLYRDAFYIAGGPLSQYYHAALFKIFGPSFLVLIISNLAITAALLLLIFQRFRRATDTLTATTIAIAIVVGFVFAQYTGVGNCNFLAPYSHEMVHGFALAVVALVLTSDWLVQKKNWRLVIAGICLGLVVLTKPDILLALLFTMLMVIAFCWWQSRSVQLVARASTLLALGTIIPLIICFLLFLRIADWRESLRWEFFGWVPVFADGVVNSSYYQWGLGLDTPFEHTRQVALYFLVCATVVTICAVIFNRTKKLNVPTRRVTVGLTLLGLVFAATKFAWVGAGAALPLIGLVTIVILWTQLKQRPADEKIIFPLVWTIFGILLLVKQGMFPRIWHTGFVLALPVFVSAVYLFLRLLPEFLEQRFRVPRQPMRIGALAVLLIALASLAAASEKFYTAKNLPVGPGADMVLANGPDGNAVEARNVNLALDWISTNLPPSATLAALPMGTMLNYLSRHANPTPCFDWTPPVLAVFGETNMTRIFTNHPPDFIALVEWQTYEYGGRYFGAEPGYGADVMTWIHQNYQPVALFGSEPLCNGLFGIKILKRRSPAGINEIEKLTAGN
jgi:hypothetical protein